MLLYSLHHGSIDIQVLDWSCTQSGKCNAFEGKSNAMFSATKNHAFTRELLDASHSDDGGGGGACRDAYVSWEAKNWSSSSAFHCIGHEFELNRQPGNDSCYAFINTLQFPSDDDLYALFSFSIFENRNREGDKLTDGVVMDGTALGISGILPEFCRSTSLVRPVPRSVSISA